MSEFEQAETGTAQADGAALARGWLQSSRFDVALSLVNCQL